MGLKEWLDFSGQRRPSSASHARSKTSTNGNSSAGAGHRRHSSLPAPRVATGNSASSAALRSSSISQDADALERNSTAFATALQVAPSEIDDAEQKAMYMHDMDAHPVTHDDDDDAFARRRRASSTSSASSQPPMRHSLMDNVRFSWHNVLGHSSRSDSSHVLADASASVEASPTEHNPDVSVRAQDRDMGVVMQGWLEKCGQQFKTWNWRFFVLRDDGVLSYYTDESMKKLKGSINVGYGARADISVQSNMIEKTCVFMIATPQRNTMISAPSPRMMTKWISKLHEAGATPSEPWDPLKKTVKFFVRDAECPHEWKRYDDPTSYIHMEGCLLKRGHVNKNWKNRFFRIEKGELRYYTENQETLKGSVPLKGTVVSPGMAQCSDGRSYYFVLTSRDGKFEMHLNAHNESSMHKWIEAIQEAQTALGKTIGSGSGTNAKETVSGLALVVKRAEEIPLAKIEVVYTKAQDIVVQIERRTEALVVTKAPKDDVPVGSQLIAVNGVSILREAYSDARERLRTSAFPLTLAFVLPPYKKGLLVKKSRSGFENWKKRVLVVTNGEVHYYKQVTSGKTTTLKHRKSFSLYGCYLNLVQLPSRPLCIVVARSPSDKLVLQTSSEAERIEWASVLYCSIRMVSQGITSGHIANLNLEHARHESGMTDAIASDIRGERSGTV